MKTENQVQEPANTGKSEIRNPKFETNPKIEGNGNGEPTNAGTGFLHETTEKTENTGNGDNGETGGKLVTANTTPEKGLLTSSPTRPSLCTPNAALLDSLTSVFRRFVVLPPWAAETLALWTVHTYCFDFRDVTTYLGLESPEKRCGKTTLLTVLSELVQRPVVAANISSPALFRVIEETRPTLLIDEADSFLKTNDELRGILNSGYTRKTAYVVRVTHERGRKSEAREPIAELDFSGNFLNKSDVRLI